MRVEGGKRQRGLSSIFIVPGLGTRPFNRFAGTMCTKVGRQCLGARRQEHLRQCFCFGRPRFSFGRLPSVCTGSAISGQAVLGCLQLCRRRAGPAAPQPPPAATRRFVLPCPAELLSRSGFMFYTHSSYSAGSAI